MLFEDFLKKAKNEQEKPAPETQAAQAEQKRDTLRMLEREFLAIVRWALEQDAAPEQGKWLLLERTKLVEVMDKHPYVSSTQKLTAWRTLHWIDADKGHFTRSVRTEAGVVRRVRVDLDVYHFLAEYLPWKKAAT